MKQCRYCGSGRQHTIGCTRPERKLNTVKPTLAMARDWFTKFGHDRGVISDNGARFFAFLLQVIDAKDGRK